MGLSEDLEQISQAGARARVYAFDAGNGVGARRRFARAGVRAQASGGDRHAALWAAAVLCRARGHYARQCGLGAAQEQCSGAIPSQLVCDWVKEKIKSESLIESQGLAIADYATHGGSFPDCRCGRGRDRQRDGLRLAAAGRSRAGIEVLCGLLGRNYEKLRLVKE